MSNNDPGCNNTSLWRVYRFLDHDLIDNALFLLDRLHAQDHNNPCWIHLRSLCCLRLDRYAAAYEYSHDEATRGEHVGCVYVFAQASLQLKMYCEGISVLERVLRSSISDGPCTERFAPDAAAMHCLLGKLHRANGDLQRAADAYAQALLANPFMWDAFTNLCDSGVTLDLSNIFRPRSSNIPTRETAIMSMPAELASPAAGEKDETMEDPADAVAPSRVSPRGFQVPAKRKQDTMAGALPLEQLTLQSDEPRSTSILSPERRTARLSPYPLLTNRGGIYRDGQLFRAMLEPKSRQPLRENQPTASTPRAKQDTKTGKAKVVAPSPKKPSRPAVLHTESSTALCGTFLTLGTAYYNLKRFQPRACLDALATLPATQQATPWVFAKTGRAHYEMMAYVDAKASFQALRTACPSWTEDLEVYAAVLWHLEDDVKLSYQAHELVETHYLSPQAWCTVGCVFSLLKRRENALAAFLRATQLQPQLAHAYSNLGHEYHDCEEYNEANMAFRQALRIDARHYIAWAGLGRVQERLGAPQRALRYYLAAQKVCDDLGTPELGLKFIRRAAQGHTSKRLAVFTKVQTAKLLLRMGEPEDAAEELNTALAMAPDNAEIHFLIGKAVVAAGGSDLNETLQRFTVALSLRPHSRVIKDALSRLGTPTNKRKITPWNT
ncbi:Tetratricopeptide-like helical [Akanthomyces lecanii RCEF 1005]|uniref:Tetratricopeptide-like helical n=1 Tax=Akanthomyces lecanii RCEF 1005 TaxID=1081108 RepID=A0A162KNP9_CORDF|nr:Tetratricopeptide-like helical [Akanthomyces lecanii RCEF 1005]